ncbi:MAG: glycoside hydrolase family 3 N-terminal domain-containing protein [Candidatus Onthomonas sp.]
MEKKRISHLGLCIVLGLLVLLTVVLAVAKCNPSPYGPDLKRITTLIFAGVCVAAAAMIALLVVRAIRNKRLLKVATIFLSLLLVLVLVLNYALMPLHIVLGLVLSGVDRDAPDTAAVNAAAMDMTERLEEEGIVLLKNNGTLPLEAGNINVFGYASGKIVFGGAGSGAADESRNVLLPTALKNAGFQVNEDLIRFYEEKAVTGEQSFMMEMLGTDYNVPEPAPADYPEELLTGAEAFSDTALVVISRKGGEGLDMPMDMADYTGGTAGRHYLEITENEQAMLDMVSERFQRVIVLINSSSAMELGFLEAEGVDAALWIGGPGSTGLNAVAKALSGQVNPSGRLPDTYAYDLTSSPAYYNTGDFTYTGSEHEASGMIAALTGATTEEYKFVNYVEGIYVGYRYYETAAADGFIDYETTVQYPFGYGLSYTTFQQEMGELKAQDGTISVDVTVTNTGAVAGREVVQLYYTAPYYPGGIEKAHVVLCAFDKTELLQPGESQTVTLRFAADEMSSYDDRDARAYVLEKGDYEIKLMKNAHEVIDSRTYTVDATTTGRASDLTQATNRFDDANGGLVYLSRADWEGTMPRERAQDQPITQELMAQLGNLDVETDPNDPEVVFAKHGLTLADVRGLDYDDPLWEQLLEQLSVADMEYLIGSSGWQSPAIHSVGKPAVIDVDGPAGINGMFNGIMGVQYTSEVVAAATWNQALIEQFGQTMGAEAVANGVSGLYGPAMNTHRTPFTGRNFEYYSEDGLLAGKIGAAMVRGVNAQGVYTYIKHFAMNDQETNCRGVATWSNEQAIREIYLRPFELCVKEGGARAVMTAFNRIGTTWAGGNAALLQGVLRDEWGFVGVVITDNTMSGAYMDADQAVFAGNDLILTPTSHTFHFGNTTTAHQKMRTACHNILYTVANSVALDVVQTGLPTWVIVVVAADVVLLGLITLGYMGATKKKKVKTVSAQQTETEKK